MSLRDQAAAATGTPLPGAAVETPRSEPADVLVPLAELEEHTGDDPPPVTVFVAWARVMRDVQGVAKKGEYNASGTRYNFRGVDAVVNAFGPACRRHGVMVIPAEVRPSHADTKSAGGKSMRETTTVVRWHIYGPLGDSIEGESEGESLDSGDKGTAKAQSIALRVFLLAAGMVPTDEKDPDAMVVERGERPMPKATDYRDEALRADTTPGRLRQMWSEARRHDLTEILVQNENGDEEKLGALLYRVGLERKGGAE